MCIRDRCIAGDAPPPGIRRVAIDAGEFEADRVALDGIVAAVSYTHLRAHETVLDLVCRLLLETKQTEQMYCDIKLMISRDHVR